MDWELRIISASYTLKDDEPVIELFGKTREGRSITVLVKDFRPYYYIVRPTPSVEKSLGNDGEVVSTEHAELLYRGEFQDVLKVTLKNPWKVSEYRTAARREGFDVLAADIPFHHRYIYDTDMGACIRVSGKEIDSYYTTDLTVEMESFENVDPFTPPLKIMSFDIENSVEHDFLYCICAVIDEGGIRRRCKPITGSEKDMITEFSELIRKEDPDVITGYNIDNYDIKKIKETAEINKMADAMPWGRDGGQPEASEKDTGASKDVWWSMPGGQRRGIASQTGNAERRIPAAPRRGKSTSIRPGWTASGKTTAKRFWNIVQRMPNWHFVFYSRWKVSGKEWILPRFPNFPRKTC